MIPATVDLPRWEVGVAKGWPIVRGVCPACGRPSLFLAAGGYVTCASLLCKDPGAASDRLRSEVTA